MKTFTVEGWFRFRGSDDKDFEIETIEALTPEEAIEKFQKNWYMLNFFKIHIKVFNKVNFI
jgi:ribosomal protein L20A (L18A)